MSFAIQNEAKRPLLVITFDGRVSPNGEHVRIVLVPGYTSDQVVFPGEKKNLAVPEMRSADGKVLDPDINITCRLQNDFPGVQDTEDVVHIFSDAPTELFIDNAVGIFVRPADVEPPRCVLTWRAGNGKVMDTITMDTLAN